MACGRSGAVLHVDLGTGRSEPEHPDELFYRRYGGGGAMAACYALRGIPPATDPLGPENLLLFFPGLLTGAPMPALARFTVAGLSPLTGGYGEAEAGGFWGTELRAAGLDGLVVTGRAPRPVYLLVREGRAEVRDASALWGLPVKEVDVRLAEELGEGRLRVAAIGPAGEAGVRYACVMADRIHAAGRTGMGAVMGAKNLKAVAVRGARPPGPADPRAVAELARWYAQACRQNPSFQSLEDLGTAGGVSGYDARGILPTANFRTGTFAGAGAIGGQAMRDSLLVDRKSCYACPGRCKRVVSATGRYPVDPDYGGPEYETVAALGSLCGVGDLAAVCRANQLCNAYGLDTISTGVAIAFALECRERRLGPPGGGPADWPAYGDADAMLAAVELIARRRGVGNLLAEGVKRAAERIGGQAPRLAMHVKGQELPMHEPRGKASVGLGYAVSPTGADHLEAEHDTNFDSPGLALRTVMPLGIVEPVDRFSLGPAKVRNFVYLQALWNLYNTLGVCLFAAAPGATLSLDRLTDLVAAVTGWETSLFELMKMGERGVTLMRAFNLRHGLGPADDALPERLFEGLEGGALAGRSLDRGAFQGALATYYAMMGWDRETGRPTPEKLEELDIVWVAGLL